MKTTSLILSLIVLTSCSEREASVAEPLAESAARPYPLEVCLVSGEKLGSMGDPVVIVHDGQEIRFCCDRCVPKFEADPGKYLPKLQQP